MKKLHKSESEPQVNSSTSITAGWIEGNLLYSNAQNIADDIAEFLNATSKIDNLSDYLDEEDMDALSKSYDALMYFARAYSDVEK